MKRRLLILAPFTPRRDAKHGGGKAIAQLVAALSARHHVAVVHLRGRDEPAMEDDLRGQCDLVCEVDHLHPSGARRLLRRARVALATLGGTPVWVGWWTVTAFARCVKETAAAWSPDIVQLEFHLMGQYLPALRDCRAPRILVQHDPGYRAANSMRAEAVGLRHLLSPIDRWAWRRYEAKIMRQVDTVIAFTERDRTALGALAGRTPVVRIPLATTPPDLPLSPAGEDPATVLFVGSFAHPPNADAARRLLDAILPRVHARRPDVRLILVGSNPPPDLHRRLGARAEIADAVPDVIPYLDRASLVVAPLRLGGGMRVKVLDALAAGKAIVATRLAAEGLDITDGREICLADTDQEFADRIVELLGDDERRRRLASAARSWACTHLSWTQVVECYERVYHALLGS